MRVFVISLKQAQERRTSIVALFSKYGIEFEFIDAFWGKSLDRENDERLFNEESFELRNNCLSKTTVRGKLTDGEMGCALSHLTAYQKIVGECPEGAIICEDDLIPNCNFIRVIEAVLKKEPDAEMIHPCTIPHEGLRQGWLNPKHKFTVDGREYTYYRAGIPGFDWLLNRRRRIANAACIYFSKKAAQRLIDIGFPARMEADRLTGMVAYNKLKVYLLAPRIGTHQTVDSTIGDGRHQKAY